MSLFDKLLVAHLVGDWLLQTEWQALNKSRDYRALFSHVSIYSAVMLSVLVVDFGFRNIYVYAVIVMFWLSHALLDRGGFVIPFMKTLRMIVDREPQRWLTMMTDQILHILIIAIAVLMLK